MELVDPKLGSNFSEDEAMAMINVALMCTNSSPALRPIMSTVVSVLGGGALNQDAISKTSFCNDYLKLKTSSNHGQQLQSQSPCSSEILISSSHQPLTGSSTSDQDLYPLILNSQYLNDR